MSLTVILSLVLLSFMRTVVVQSDATLSMNVDNLVNVYISSDGSSASFRLIGSETNWQNTLTVTIPESDITSSTIIKFECTDSGSVGGFIANVHYKSNDYYTTNPIDNTIYEFISSSDGIASLVYTANGAGTWGTRASLPANAFWIWNGRTGNKMVFHFKFATAFTLQPTAAPTGPPSKSPTESPSESPTKLPSKSPSFAPSSSPTSNPITRPPTLNPTTAPSIEPTLTPTDEPSLAPTIEPTFVASAQSKTTTMVTEEVYESTEANAESTEEGDEMEHDDMMQLLLDNLIIIAIGAGSVCLIISAIVLYLKCRTGKVKLYKPNTLDDDVITTVIQKQKSQKSIGSASEADDAGLFRVEKPKLKTVKSADKEEVEEIKIEIDEDMFQRTLTQIYGENNADGGSKAASDKVAVAPPSISAPNAAPPPSAIPSAAPIPAPLPTAAPIPNAAPPVAPMIPERIGNTNSMDIAGEYEMIDVNEASGDTKGQCVDCGQTKSGKTYEEDGLFYCWECWKAYGN